MKLATSDLKEALGRVSKLSTKRTTLPILSCVLLSAEGGTLSISATDLDTWAVARCECDGDLEPICVGAFQLGALLASAGEIVTLKLAGALRIEVESGIKCMLACQDAEGFPAFPEKGKAIGLNCEDLAAAMDSVKWAASTDANKESDMKRCAVGVDCSAKEIMAAAFSGLKLAVHQIPSIAADANFMCPVASVTALCQALREPEAVFSLSDNYAMVKTNALDVACKLIEGTYFDVKGQMLAAKRRDIGVVEKDRLIRSLRTAQMIGRRNPNGFVRTDFEFTKSGLTVKYSGDNTFEDFIEGKFTSETLSVNAALCEEALASVNAPAPNVSFGDQRQFCFEHGGYIAFVAVLAVPKEKA